MAENQNIEWKSKWDDDYLAWICGFANAQGGKLYIGVDESGNVVGLTSSHKMMEDIPNKIRDTMGIIVAVTLHSSNGEECIEIAVPSYPVAISYRGAYYMRSGATNQRLVGAELESFILRRRGVNWESLPLPGFTLDDIDDDAIRLFKDKAMEKGRLQKDVLSETKECLMDKLHLKNAGYFTNGAALLFSADPERWFLGAFIKVGYFETNADLIYQDEVRGSLLQQVDKTLDLIYFKYLKAKISYRGVQRIERYPFPENAIREALLNAIIHKKYESGIPIQISVYDDRLYIANIGQLPENWSLETLMNKHASRPNNPNIADTFYLAGFIESWGRGIEKIFGACEEDGVPAPIYTINPGDIMIQFTAPENRIITLRNNKEAANEEVGEEINRSDKILLAIRKNNRLTKTQLAEQLGFSKGTLDRELTMLKNKNKIKRVGSNKTGYWEIIE